ncbi:MAG: autotransporter-associated beta strand repeat-containing protein [Planctomycetota bacterium]
MRTFVSSWCVLAAAALTATPTSAQIRLQLVKQLDMAALGAGQPGSVAAYGTHLYAGSLGSGGNLYHIVNPLGTPGLAVTFGGLKDPATNGGLASPGVTTNGYVSLYTDGVTLVAATNNGGNTPDIAQSYLFGSETLNWGGNSGPGSLETQTYRIDGAAVDPISGNVMATGWGGDAQNFYSPTVAAPVAVPDANILYYDPGVKTGWRDVSYDHATGDIYLRAANGAARGQRIADGRFVTLNGTTPGIQTIVSLVNPLTSAINVEYLPSSFAGQGLVIMNNRELRGTTFADIVKTFSATPPTSAPTSRSPGGVATTTPVAVSFVRADGVTPFTTTTASSGIYDFSYNPVDNRLYVSDYSTSQIHVFGLAPQIIVIDVTSGTQTQTQAGYPTLSGSIPVVKTGAGTLVLDQANTLSGTTTVQAGVLRLANAAALSSSRLTVAAGGTAQVAAYVTAGVAGLAFSGAGLVDVTNGGLTVAAGLSPTTLVARLL